MTIGSVRFRGASRFALALLTMLIAIAPVAADEIDFAHDIVPILRRHCAACHTGERKEGNFSMNTRGSLLAGGDGGRAVISGDSGKSALLERIAGDDEFTRMPPEGPLVPPEQAALLERWIDAGLPWQEGFSFLPKTYEPPLRPRLPELPPSRDGRTNPVDRIIDAYLAEQNLPRPEPADDASFARRVHLDLIGLLPEPRLFERFVADRSSDKRERLVRRLLDDDLAYAEHWLTFWNDLLRNDYSGTGYITGGRKQITRWLHDALRENKPYDEFVRELIAPTPESEGFIRGIRWRGDVNSSQTESVQFAQNVSQAFLGINMKCASCHDSFIDRWKLDEAYGLAAIHATSPLEIHRCDKPTGRIAKAAWIFPELGEIDPAADRQKRLEQLAGLMTHPDNGRLTRTIVNRLWHRLMGRGIVHPVDAMHTEPWSADLLDHLAVHLAENQYDLKKSIELIATSRAYEARTPRRETASDADAYRFDGPVARRMTAEQFVDAVWRITGEAPPKHDAPGLERPGDPAPMVRAALMKNDFFMRSLGRPTRDQIVSMRPSELATLEAIDLANSPFLAETIARGARRRLAEFDSPTALIDWLFAAALSRSPTADERRLALDSLGETPAAENVEDLLWAVFMLPEFQLIR
ncbi:MAG: PSD1 and planctomycete cytochrome C domain-containing protein [Planctomycetaceae bacterium]